MHLLIVSHSCATPENRQLYATLRERTGWKITLVVPRHWKDEFQNTLTEKPWPSMDDATVYLPVLGSGNIILHAYIARWRKFLKSQRFDAIFVCHEPYAVATFQIWLANRLARRVPFGFHSCQNIRKEYPIPFRQMEAMVCKSSAFAFPITPDVQAVIASKGFCGQWALCPFPVDTRKYTPDAVERLPESLRKRPGDPVVIGYVGRVVEAKGFRTLAAALGLIRDVRWKFVIIGAGDFEAEFDRLVSECGVADRIEKRGFIPHAETPAHMADMDVLVLPSETQPNWKEQFGRVVLESMACGTPVVGSDSGEIPKLIFASGGGVVFPERNAEALAGALRQMIENEGLRDETATAGRTWVNAHVGMESVADAIAKTITAAAPSKT